MSNKEFKELLTLAAKAAGYRLCHFGCPFQGAFVADDLKGRSFYWNPRDSMEDAFKLASHFGMIIDFACGTVMIGHSPDLWRLRSFTPGNTVEACSAILRAAAEIGRNMP